MSKIISPIAIDMGAKNTGVYLNHFEQGEDPTTSGKPSSLALCPIKTTWGIWLSVQFHHVIPV
jgi:hypothetical protein